jgi:hypothetical protein
MSFRTAAAFPLDVDYNKGLFHGGGKPRAWNKVIGATNTLIELLQLPQR